VRLKRWHGETNEPDESVFLVRLSRVQPKAVRVEVMLDALEKRVALGAGQSRRHELHDTHVGIETCEWLAVAALPFPQYQTICFDQEVRLPSTSRSGEEAPMLRLFFSAKTPPREASFLQRIRNPDHAGIFTGVRDFLRETCK